MFSTFKILVIYLIISSRCTCMPTSNGKTTTLSFEEKVKKELDPLKDKLEKIMVNVPVPLQVELKLIQGELEGEMKKIIERTVGAETKNEVLLQDKGALQIQKNEADKYKILLALTHRIDELEKSFHPNPTLGGDRYKRWMQIFALKTPMVEELRDKVTAAGMTQEQFCKEVQTLCNERNDRAGHAAVELPTCVDEQSIHDALLLMKITPYKTTKETLRILISPFESGDLTSTNKP